MMRKHADNQIYQKHEKIVRVTPGDIIAGDNNFILPGQPSVTDSNYAPNNQPAAGCPRFAAYPFAGQTNITMYDEQLGTTLRKTSLRWRIR